MISELRTVPGHIVHTEHAVWQPTVIVQSHFPSCTNVVPRKIGVSRVSAGVTEKTVTVPTGTTVTRRLPPRLRLRLRSRKGGMAQELERSAGPGAEADVGAGAVHTSCLRLRQRLRL